MMHQLCLEAMEETFSNPKSKRGRPREHVQKDIVNAILSILKGGYYLANDAE
jgi:hypothetical protein